MNRSLTLLPLLLAPLLGASGCASHEDEMGCEPAPPHETMTSSPAPGQESRAYLGARNLPADGVALDGYCPVAYFTDGAPAKGRAEFRSTYEGVTYLFSSAEAERLFDADPQKYLPAYGGWCAYGMAVGDKFPVDPTSFEIVDGRLMLFLHNEDVDARGLWSEGDDAELKARADVHWKKVRG